MTFPLRQVTKKTAEQFANNIDVLQYRRTAGRTVIEPDA